MKEIMTPEEAALIVQQSNLISRAWIADQIAQRPFSVQIETIDLNTAVLETNPKILRGQFKSIYVQEASDVNVYVNVKLGSRDSTQSAFKMRANDSISMSQPMNEMYLHWPAQSGKTLTLVKFTDVQFQSGSQVSIAGGGVAILTGTTVTGPTTVTLIAATQGIIIPANTSRKQVTLQNKTGADLYIGGSTLISTEGIKVSADGLIVWTNTAALYGYSTGGGDVAYIEEV